MPYSPASPLRPLPAGIRRPVMRPHRSRAAILTAARELFRDRPWESVSMEMIAARAGVTRRTVYNQFADAAELFHAAREALVFEVAELLPLEVAGDLSPAAALRAYCRLVSEAFADPRYSELIGSIVRDGWSAAWLVEAYQRYIRLPVLHGLEERLQAVRPGRGDVRRMALNLLSAIESASVSSLLLPTVGSTAIDVAERGPDMVDGLLAWICPPPGGPTGLQA